MGAPKLVLTDRVNLAVARLFAVLSQRRRGSHEEAFLNALSDDPNPTALFVYLTYLSGGWNTLFYGFALLAIGAGYLEHKLDGSLGIPGFVAVGFFSIASLIGQVDAGWRERRADQATRPDADSEEVVRLVRSARSASDIGIVLQTVGGLLGSALLWYLL